MRKIYFRGSNSDKFTIVDHDDYLKLKNIKWYLSVKGYVVTSKGKYMHRIILNLTNSKICVDHINLNKTDNRKINLREAINNKGNPANINKYSDKKYTSKYKGVYWHKRARKWCAELKPGNSKVYLGLFKNEMDAAIAYDDAAIKHYGEFARTNF